MSLLRTAICFSGNPTSSALQMMAPGKMSDFVGGTTIVSQEVDDNKAHLTAGITEPLARDGQIIGRCSTKPLAHTPEFQL